MKDISAIVITKNAAEHIGRCVAALAKVCADIVVIDTDSSDDTVMLAEQAGARVVNSDWLGFGATKNFGAEQARFDWILSIDADEVLSEELVMSIKNLDLDPQSVYQLDRISSLCGKWIRHSGWYPDWIPRLYHRKEVRWNDAPVHERLIIPANFDQVRLKGKLYHYSYTSYEQFDKKLDRYARLSAQSMISKNKKYSPMIAQLAPAFRYFRTLVLKLGFLDGREGFWLSRKNAQLVKKKYEYFYQMTTDTYLEN